jgi:hypothetical protein
MDALYCLIDPDGRVYAKAGADSYAAVAAAFGLREDECAAYRFDLEKRRLVADRPTAVGDAAVWPYLDKRFGTPTKLIASAQEGALSKLELADLLTLSSRQRYLAACAVIEKRFTERCTAANDPCLEGGCASEGEYCLEPLMRAGAEYHKACAAEWIAAFADPDNRVPAWIH